MKIPYTHLANVDGRLTRRYQPGDRLVCYPRTTEGDHDEPSMTVAERAYTLHHSQDDPEAWRYPAIEVGDVIIVCDIALAVSPTGLEPVRVERSDVISESDWIHHLSTAFLRHNARLRSSRHLRPIAVQDRDGGGDG